MILMRYGIFGTEGISCGRSPLVTSIHAHLPIECKYACIWRTQAARIQAIGTPTRKYVHKKLRGAQAIKSSQDYIKASLVLQVQPFECIHTSIRTILRHQSHHHPVRCEAPAAVHRAIRPARWTEILSAHPPPSSPTSEDPYSY